jgi:hypothetical protein
VSCASRGAAQVCHDGEIYPLLTCNFFIFVILCFRYTLAGVVSCLLQESPFVPMLHGDHVPVPTAALNATCLETQNPANFVCKSMTQQYLQHIGDDLARKAQPIKPS